MLCDIALWSCFAYKDARNRIGHGRVPVQTLTEIVAAVVVHSSAAAYSHFGVTLEAKPMDKPVPAERTVARTVAPKKILKITDRPMKSAQCVQSPSPTFKS